jgi:DNA mismatch repair protein MutL
MTRIRILNDHLVSQIAAGEVVERPASVVKELVENALDAESPWVRIELEAGGRRSVRVDDGGVGMDRDDALLAFDRHATSKIGSFEDLQGVVSLGFRGEALAAIAAVARVELLTAMESGEGHRVQVDGGKVRAVEPVAHPRGTSVTVRSLFFNVPARRKFLKTARTELRRSTEIVQGYALARPEVGFTVVHDGRTLLDVAPAGEGAAGVERRIAEMFGATLSDALVAFAAEDPVHGSIWGLVGDRTTTRGRRIFTFVNRRLLRDRAMMSTFYRAVREEWRSDEFPALFLFADVPPHEVDVNVHPQKAEVRFRDRRFLDRLASCLRKGLVQARGEEPAPLHSPFGSPALSFAWQGLGERPRGAASGESGLGSVGELREGRESGDLPPGRLADVAYAPLERTPIPLSGRSGEVRPFRLLGQYKASLILLEGPDGLYVVDQHVAHERILYERLRVQMATESVSSQQLLEPILAELGPAEAMRLIELIPELDSLGFSLVEMSGNTLAIQAVPAVLSADLGESMLLSLAASDAVREGEPEDLREELLQALAANQSCRSAIKIHHPLTAEEMETVVSELFAADQPFSCPHGRPTVLMMSDLELEKRFGRR